jgi:NADH-quinone oxidoreductase subunit N
MMGMQVDTLRGAMISAELLRALLPEITLVVGAMVLLLVSAWGGEHHSPTRRSTRFALGVIGLTIGAVILAWIDAPAATSDGRIATDGFRYAFDLLVLAGAAGALVVLDTEQMRTRAFQAEVPVLLLLAVSGAMVLAAARDLMVLYIGLELMSISSYVLAGSSRSSARSAQSSMTYFLLGSFASAFLLYGIALLFGATGDVRLDAIRAATIGPMYVTGLGLLFIGMAFKVAAVPFHYWAADVYDGAPTPITAFMAATVKAAVLALMLRVAVEGLGGAVNQWRPVLWWIAALSIVVGNAVAINQSNVKRMLAYSSVAHAGYLLTGVVAHSPAGTAAVVFYLAMYTLATIAIFAVLATVAQGIDREIQLQDLRGLWHIRPHLAVVIGVSLLALLGFPVLGGGGFFGKWFLLQATLESMGGASVALALIIVAGSLLSAGYYLRVLAIMFHDERASDAVPPIATPGLLRAVMIVAVTALLLFGLWPSPAATWAAHATFDAAVTYGF